MGDTQQRGIPATSLILLRGRPCDFSQDPHYGFCQQLVQWEVAGEGQECVQCLGDESAVYLTGVNHDAFREHFILGTIVKNLLSPCPVPRGLCSIPCGTSHPRSKQWPVRSLCWLITLTFFLLPAPFIKTLWLCWANLKNPKNLKSQLISNLNCVFSLHVHCLQDIFTGSQDLGTSLWAYSAQNTLRAICCMPLYSCF